MSQFQEFNVYIANGQQTVRAIWEVIHGTVTGGPFVAGEGLTWGVDGVGVFLSTANNAMRLYRTSGAEPAEGDTITGGTSTATTPINQIDTQDSNGVDINPPRFADSPSQGAIMAGDLVAVADSGAADIVAQVGGSIGRDSFTLVANWSPATVSDVAGFVSRDLTPNRSYPLVHPGAGRAGTILSEAVRRIDADINSILGGSINWKDVDNDSVAGWQGNWDDLAPAVGMVRWFKDALGYVNFEGYGIRTPAFVAINEWSIDAREVARVSGTRDVIGVGSVQSFLNGADGTVNLDATDASFGNAVTIDLINDRVTLAEDGIYRLSWRALAYANGQDSAAAKVGAMELREDPAGTPALIAVSRHLIHDLGVGTTSVEWSAVGGEALLERTGTDRTFDLYLTNLGTLEDIYVCEVSLTIEKMTPTLTRDSSQYDELMFTLPVGFRPSYDLILTGHDTDTYICVKITTDGEVRYIGTGTGARAELTGLRFLAA